MSLDLINVRLWELKDEYDEILRGRTIEEFSRELYKLVKFRDCGIELGLDRAYLKPTQKRIGFIYKKITRIYVISWTVKKLIRSLPKETENSYRRFIYLAQNGILLNIKQLS